MFEVCQKVIESYEVEFCFNVYSESFVLLAYVYSKWRYNQARAITLD